MAIEYKSTPCQSWLYLIEYEVSLYCDSQSKSIVQHTFDTNVTNACKKDAFEFDSYGAIFKIVNFDLSSK